MGWLIYIFPFAGILLVGLLFTQYIAPQLQRAVGQ